MKNPFSAQFKRKSYFQNLANELDRIITDHCSYHLNIYREDPEPSSIRGLFIDRRTLRAISLKVKMLLTLLSKAYLLWLNSPSVRKLINFPPELETWIRKNPWRSDDVLIINISIIPFISREYIQPSIKFLDIQCDRIAIDSIFQRILSEKNLNTWNSLGIETSCFSFIDSLSFFKECIMLAIGKLSLYSPPSICLIGDRESTDKKMQNSLDHIVSSLKEMDLVVKILAPDELEGAEEYDLLINMVGIVNLSRWTTEAGLARFKKYWDEKKIINRGAHPVFGRGIFELLTDNRYQCALGYPPIETVKRMIPWTRIIRDEKTNTATGESVSLPEYIIKSQKYLTIRPNFPSSEDIEITGEHSTPELWSETLKKALEKPFTFVVQENLEFPHITLPFIINEKVQFEKTDFTLDLTVNERGNIGGIGAKLYFNERSTSKRTGSASVIIAELE